MRQFGGVSESSVDMFRSKARVARQNLVLRRAFRQVIEDNGDRNSRPYSTNLAAADLRIAGEEVVPGGHVFILSVEH